MLVLTSAISPLVLSGTKWSRMYSSGNIKIGRAIAPGLVKVFNILVYYKTDDAAVLRAAALELAGTLYLGPIASAIFSA